MFLSVEGSMRKFICVLLVWLLVEAATSFGLEPPSPICGLGYRTFLHDLNSQCPFIDPFSSSPMQVDGESFERAMRSLQKNEFTAVLFYASWCPFSRIFQSRFSTLSSMYPQIKHIMVEQSSVMPSVFSKYGIHSVPSLLIVNQTAPIRYNGRKDLRSLISFYKKTTGMDPLVDMVEETSKNMPFMETSTREPYLILSALFVLLRAFMYIYPEISSRLSALWAAYIPNLNLGTFRESGHLLGHVLHLIDIKRIWSKLKISKTGNFHEGARNARVWASSLASMSLGETSSSSSRVYPSRDF